MSIYVYLWLSMAIWIYGFYGSATMVPPLGPKVWSLCSASCGSGRQSRSRLVLVEAEGASDPDPETDRSTLWIPSGNVT